jgi:hypothetical protein
MREKRKTPRQKLEEYGIHSFWYLTHIDNIKSILANGILPYDRAKTIVGYNFEVEEIHMRGQGRGLLTSDGKYHDSHEMVEVAINPVIPILMSNIELLEDLLLVQVKSSLVYHDRHVSFGFSNGDISSKKSELFYSLNRLSEIDYEVIWSKNWKDYDDGERKRCAGFFIYPRIPIDRIAAFFVATPELALTIQNASTSQKVKIDVIVDQHKFRGT